MQATLYRRNVFLNHFTPRSHHLQFYTCLLLGSVSSVQALQAQFLPRS